MQIVEQRVEHNRVRQMIEEVAHNAVDDNVSVLSPRLDQSLEWRILQYKA